MGGGRGPNPKNQLATLVAKLDQLSGKPLSVSLDGEKGKKIREQLAGLEGQNELTDEDAKKRLDAILEIVEGDRETLESAGYRWPGEGGGFRPPMGIPNPFVIEENGKHLKTLQAKLGKPTTPEKVGVPQEGGEAP
jgi:hypothetical protein